MMISAFALSCITLISLTQLATIHYAVAEQTGLCLSWSQPPQKGFLATRPIRCSESVFYKSLPSAADCHYNSKQCVPANRPYLESAFFNVNIFCHLKVYNKSEKNLEILNKISYWV